MLIVITLQKLLDYAFLSCFIKKTLTLPIKIQETSVHISKFPTRHRIFFYLISFFVLFLVWFEVLFFFLVVYFLCRLCDHNIAINNKCLLNNCNHWKPYITKLGTIVYKTDFY